MGAALQVLGIERGGVRVEAPTNINVDATATGGGVAPGAVVGIASGGVTIYGGALSLLAALALTFLGQPIAFPTGIKIEYLPFLLVLFGTAAYLFKALSVQVPSMPTGSIVAYASTIPPEGWLLCDGQTLNPVANRSHESQLQYPI
jgi:hypothetical protein